MFLCASRSLKTLRMAALNACRESRDRRRSVLGGPSGAGKSSILKMIYGNYRCDAGRILVRDGEAMVDVASAEPRRILMLRASVMG